jgi:hypothetical protein
MKKNFIIFAALMVTAFFGAEIAKAADVSIGGQIFTRAEINEHGSTGNAANDFTDRTDASDFVLQRTAVDIKAKINDTTSAFIQLQSNRNWAAGDDNTSGSNDSSFSANDSGNSVGIHEAYFTLKNFASLPVDAKIGKQEIILDGHRLLGDTLWTMGQTSHDAVRFDHAHGNLHVVAAYVLASEAGLATSANAINQTDVEDYLLHANYKGILGGQLSVIYNYLNDPCGTNGTICGNAQLSNDIHTIGFRQAGQLYGIDYRGEYYYQWGDADQDASVIAGRTNDVTSGTSVDRDAYMFGVRVGKAFNNVNMKPSLTLWYDYLSGTSDDDLTGTDVSWKSFNTLFDTGHKFYGLQDLFLGVGSGNATNGTSGLGLQDIAIKTKISPMPGWTLKADYHWFYTAEGVVGNPGAGIGGPVGNLAVDAAPRDRSSSLGNELDITLVNKYNANTKIMIGFSNYTTTAAFRDLRSVVGDGANWAYLQFDVKF